MKRFRARARSARGTVCKSSVRPFPWTSENTDRSDTTALAIATPPDAVDPRHLLDHATAYRGSFRSVSRRS